MQGQDGGLLAFLSTSYTWGLRESSFLAPSCSFTMERMINGNASFPITVAEQYDW